MRRLVLRLAVFILVLAGEVDEGPLGLGPRGHGWRWRTGRRSRQRQSLGRSPRWRTWWRRRCDGEGEDVLKPQEGALLLLCAHKDDDLQLLVLGELRWQLVVLAALVRKKDVVHNVADEIVGVVADRLAGVIVAAGRWGRRSATVVVVAVIDVPIVDIPVVATAIVPVVTASVVPTTVVIGGLRGPALVAVAVAKIPGVPLCSPFLGPECFPGRGRDGELRVTPQVREE
jgi:hypothetical protein